MRKWEGRVRSRENQRANTKSAITFPKKGPVTIGTGDDCHMMRRSEARGRRGRDDNRGMEYKEMESNTEAKGLPIIQTATHERDIKTVE